MGDGDTLKRKMVSPEVALRRYGHTNQEIRRMKGPEKDAALKEAMEAGVSFAPNPPDEGDHEAPIAVRSEDDLRRAEAVVNSNPTAAQADAENYKHGHIELPELGLSGQHSISIETVVGGTRNGPLDPATGEPKWIAKMGATYGRIKSTKGADGDPIDVFVGPNPEQVSNILVIDQVDPSSGRFDEHKVFLGFDKPLNAVKAYMASHEGDAADRIGGICHLTAEEFQEWLKGDTTQPIAMGRDTKAPVSEAMVNGVKKGPDVDKEVNDGPEASAAPIYNESTPDPRAAVERALRKHNVDPSRVHHRDFDRAVTIHAEEGAPAEQAFPVAVLRNLVEDGNLSRSDVIKSIGNARTETVLGAKQSPKRGVRSETRRASAGGKASKD